MLKHIKMGPAVLVTAAFIGPGTVITASLAGANYGYSLIWALLFATFATIILQEMAARLGVVTQMGLGENLRQAIHTPIIKWLMLGLVFCAIVVGNGAYQSGNISGASLGIESLFPRTLNFGSNSLSLWPSVIGTIAFALMWTGSYRLIERALIVLVMLMSGAFLLTFMLTRPNIGELVSGMLIPTIPDGAALTVIALIGTTIVPYNLFLHASSARQKWQSPEQLPQARRDLLLSIPLGGLISVAIVATAASAFFNQQVKLQSVADLAPALHPLFGDWAKNLMAIGLFAAGISSAITAPLAAAFALSGILNFKADFNSHSFKLIWISILAIGVFVSSLGFKPVSLIWFAQVANGLLLPIITAFLLWMMNQPVLAGYANSRKQNWLGGLILLVTILLGGRSLMSAFGLV